MYNHAFCESKLPPIVILYIVVIIMIKKISHSSRQETNSSSSSSMHARGMFIEARHLLAPRTFVRHTSGQNKFEIQLLWHKKRFDCTVRAGDSSFVEFVPSGNVCMHTFGALWSLQFWLPQGSFFQVNIKQLCALSWVKFNLLGQLFHSNIFLYSWV